MINHFRFSRNPFKIVMWILGGVAFAALLAFLFGYFVMLLWNWLMPAIFGVGTITYLQGWGLVILCHLLFKGGHHKKHFHPRHHNREGWKRRFKERIRNPRHHFEEDEPKEPEED